MSSWLEGDQMVTSNCNRCWSVRRPGREAWAECRRVSKLVESLLKWKSGSLSGGRGVWVRLRGRDSPWRCGYGSGGGGAEVSPTEYSLSLEIVSSLFGALRDVAGRVDCSKIIRVLKKRPKSWRLFSNGVEIHRRLLNRKWKLLGSVTYCIQLTQEPTFPQICLFLIY